LNSTIPEKISLMKSMLVDKNFKNLLTLSNDVLKYDPNNSELLSYRFHALCGLNLQYDDIGFLRKYCWYRSSSADAFWHLSVAYQVINDHKNALLACAFCLSLSPSHQKAVAYLTQCLSQLGFSHLKVAVLTVSRLGHLVVEPDSWFRQTQKRTIDDSTYYIFLSDGKAANESLYERLKTQLVVLENDYWIRMFNSRPMLLADEFYEVMPYDVNSRKRGHVNDLNTYKIIRELFRNTKPIYDFSFLSSSERYKCLARVGISESDRFVCLHIRDSAYLDRMALLDTSYHNFRDSQLSSYELTINYLIEFGYKVVRLGKETNQYISVDSEHFIDLHLLGNLEQRDLLDVLLLQHCDFLISSPCGVTDLATSLDTPILVANAAPFCPYYGGKARILPKSYFDSNANMLNFSDIFNGIFVLNNGEEIHMCLDGNVLSANGIYTKDCDAEDILNSVKEFITVVKENHFTQPTSLQIRYLESLPDKIWFKESECWVTDCYLEKYQHLFFEPTQNKIVEVLN
jgi:putative glycosyltransferase (TIGR04372 family)